MTKRTRKLVLTAGVVVAVGSVVVGAAIGYATGDVPALVYVGLVAGVLTVVASAQL